MKYLLPIGFLFVFSVSLQAQSKSWGLYTSVEEGIHVSDIRPSYNYFNLSVPAGNAGMRLGAFYTHNEQISAEITLGVIGVSTPNRFSSGLIPIEVVGHYNILQETPVDWLSKFNLDLGLGSSLAESSPGNYGFSEHMVVGATAELGNVLPFGTLMMGTRYTMFIDDFIDGYVDGTGNDQILRFFTGLRINLDNSNSSNELAAAQAKIDKLSSELIAAELAYSDLSAQKEGATSSLKEENDELRKKLDALKNSSPNSTTINTEVINEFNGYHVVIGSFPEESMANEYLATVENTDAKVVYVESIPTYRVVVSEHQELRDALLALEKAMSITPNAWIAVY